MAERNAASVLPEPVGASSSVWSPRRRSAASPVPGRRWARRSWSRTTPGWAPRSGRGRCRPSPITVPPGCDSDPEVFSNAYPSRRATSSSRVPRCFARNSAATNHWRCHNWISSAESRKAVLSLSTSASTRASLLEIDEAVPQECQLVSVGIEARPFPIDQHEPAVVVHHVAGGHVAMRKPQARVDAPGDADERRRLFVGQQSGPARKLQPAYRVEPAQPSSLRVVGAQARPRARRSRRCRRSEARGDTSARAARPAPR